MAGKHQLDGFDTKAARLEREWLISVQTPVGGVESVLDALKRNIPLVQGAYDNCTYVTGNGHMRFRSREGAHGGPEETIQKTSATEITFSIPPDPEMLDRVFETVFTAHVNEEPTIRVQELWGSRSKYVDDKDNPNRYWNRTDADEIHGAPS